MAARKIDFAVELIGVSAEAQARLHETVGANRGADRLALEVSVAGRYRGQPTYGFSLIALRSARDDDVVDWHDDVALVIPGGSVEALRGAMLDVPRPDTGGFVVHPASPPPSTAAGVES